MPPNRLRRLSQSIRRSKSQAIRRSKSQPFLRRDPDSTASNPRPAPAPAPAPAPPPPVETRRQRRRGSLTLTTSAPTPTVVQSSPSRRYVRVSVADFVTSPTSRRSTPRDAVGPVDAAARPPCYDFNSPDHLPPSSPVEQAASSDHPLSLDIGTPVVESYPNHHSEPSHLVPYQCHHRQPPQSQCQQQQLNAHHQRTAPAVPVYLVNDRDYFERLANIVKARPSEPESDRSVSTIASCHSCQHPVSAHPPVKSLDASAKHAGSASPKTAAAVAPPPGPCRFPKYRAATDDGHQLLASEFHLYSSPCISSIADSSANSTFVSSLSINTNSSGPISSSQCPSDLSIGAIRDASSLNNSSFLSESRFAPPLSRHITATPDYSDAHPIDIGSDIQSALQSRNVSEQIVDSLLDDLDESSESSAPRPVIQRSNTYLLLPEPHSPSSDVPSDRSILRSVHSVDSLADLNKIPTPPQIHPNGLRKSLPSFWQQKIQSPVKYTFRPLHKIASHSTNKSKDDRTSSPPRAPVIQRAIGRRPVPVPTVPSPPSSDSNPSSVDSPAASITPPRSKLRLPRFEKTLAYKRSPNSAISAPVAINAIVDSVDPRAMLEAVNIPAVNLSPVRLFRKSRVKRASNESSTTTTSTEYYQDDYTKFIEKKSTSPLRLLPHPSFARLIGADGRALRTSRCDERTNSSLSLSTSDEEYRPFCSKLDDCKIGKS